ncbi:MAG TPA: c-type cytochrome [Planctomycetes bacterium]|nr:c-type cytochrome [Planctomycetota bacterium]
MRRIAPALPVLFLAALAGTGCRREKSLPPAPAEPPYALRRGNFLYRNWCAPCHGEKGCGDGLGWGQGRRPRPADLTALKHRSPRALEALLSERPKGSSCPSWKKNFTPSEIRDLAAWLETLGAEKKQGTENGPGKEEGR